MGRPQVVIDDLEEEECRLESILQDLRPEDWDRPSAASGWSVQDVVLHLAQTEEALVNVVAGRHDEAAWTLDVGRTDEIMEQRVSEERQSSQDEVFERWKTARRLALLNLREIDPERKLPWAAAPLLPSTLATTRLAEHWAHGLDITGPLKIEFKDTDRLWHIARLAFRTLPFAFSIANIQGPPSVYVELDPPAGGDKWKLGDPGAGCSIRGLAGDFCRVAARRLSPEETDLESQGSRAEEVLRLIRTYA